MKESSNVVVNDLGHLSASRLRPKVVDLTYRTAVGYPYKNVFGCAMDM